MGQGKAGIPLDWPSAPGESAGELMKLQNQAKLVMIGDSITDADRKRPEGEGLFGALGRGYVAQIDALLQAAYPERLIRVVNQGESGNTVRSLQARWQRDVLDKHPDWLSIMIGINDVWRQFDLPWQTEEHVLLPEYAATLEDLIRQARPHVQGLVLMTPFFIEPNRGDAMRAQMDRYGDVVRELAEKYDAVFVDVQAAFEEMLHAVHPGAVAWDRIHPTQAGHMVIARAFLKALDFAW